MSDDSTAVIQILLGLFNIGAVFALRDSDEPLDNTLKRCWVIGLCALLDGFAIAFALQPLEYAAMLVMLASLAWFAGRGVIRWWSDHRSRSV